MRFKEFLSLAEEGEAIPPWKLKPAKMEYAEIKEWVGHNAIHFIQQDCMIWRGVDSAESVEGLYNGSVMNRRAANTLNYYNLWMNNHAQWAAFPPRAKSFICTTDKQIAEGYGTPYVVIPQDSSNIGICPRHDLWPSFKGIMRIASHQGMDTFMIFTAALTHLSGMAGNPEYDWDLFAAMLNKIDGQMITAGIKRGAFKNVKEIAEKFIDFMHSHGLETAYQAFEILLDPKQNNFMMEKASAFDIDGDREVWMTGGVLLLEEETWHKIARDFHL